jgi:hypothetical protein
VRRAAAFHFVLKVMNNMNRLDRVPDGRWLPAVLTAAGFAALSAAALAQAPPAGIDPQAQALLKRSTDYVAGLKQFSVDTQSTIEVVLDSGQKLQFANGASASVQRPNRLVSRRAGDLVNQVYYYDGKSLTLYKTAERLTSI